MHVLPSPGSFSRDALGPTGTMVLGDGSATGLVFVSRALLARICDDAQTRARTGPHEHFEIGGLLIGPKPQNGELRVEEAMPLGFEYRFGPSFPMLLAGLDSVDPGIAAPLQDGSRMVVGLYRILTRSDGALRANDLEMLAALEKSPSALPHFQCCFIAAPGSRSEILLRVLVPKSGEWEEMQQITLHLDSVAESREPLRAEPSPEPTPEPTPEPSPQPAPELPPPGSETAAIAATRAAPPAPLAEPSRDLLRRRAPPHRVIERTLLDQPALRLRQWSLAARIPDICANRLLRESRWPRVEADLGQRRRGGVEAHRRDSFDSGRDRRARHSADRGRSLQRNHLLHAEERRSCVSVRGSARRSDRRGRTRARGGGHSAGGRSRPGESGCASGSRGGERSQRRRRRGEQQRRLADLHSAEIGRPSRGAHSDTKRRGIHRSGARLAAGGEHGV
jgi:hypothetical protein